MSTTVSGVPPVGIDRPVDFFTDITSVPVTGLAWNDQGTQMTFTFGGDLSPAVQAAIKWRIMARNSAEEQLLGQAFAAMQTNRAFDGLTSPTSAQVVAAVKAHGRQINGIIRRVLDELDGTD